MATKARSRRTHRNPLNSNSWHLVRCPSCRKLILNSEPKCAHCAAWQGHARAFAFGFGSLFIATLGISIFLAGQFWMHSAQKAQQDREDAMLVLKEHSHR